MAGRLAGTLFGLDAVMLSQTCITGITTYPMAALNTGIAFRFLAPDTRDLTAVRLNFSSVASAGSITVRIETDNGTNLYPSGTLYDASATKAFTPVAGWQTVTFDTPPTAGMTQGGTYYIVILTTTGGTTQTLRAYLLSSASLYPDIALTAADGTTRSNFAEVAVTAPVCSVIFEDGSEEQLGFNPWATTGTYNVFGTASYGMKFVIPTGQTWVLRKAMIPFMTRTGTPAGNFRFRILNSADVSQIAVTALATSMTGASSRRVSFPLGGLSLPAGTYRAVLDSQSSANSANCWTLRTGVLSTANLASSSFMHTSTTDVTAGTITWTDTNTEQPAINFDIDDITVISVPVGQQML